MDYRPQHLSFNKLIMLAKVVPFCPVSRQGTITIMCTLCLWLLIRRPWRGKQTLMSYHKIKPARRAGQCVSVDQMESTIPVPYLPHLSAPTNSTRSM
eukprot:7814885-Ditylum_brightwellii.AAC.1